MYLYVDLMQGESCSLQDIRWQDFLKGNRTSICSTNEHQKRLVEAKILLRHVFGSSYNDCLSMLAKEEATAKFLVENVSELQSELRELMQPTRDALLAFKDRLRIPDHEWPYVVDTFHLPANCTIHHIRKLRDHHNHILPVHATPGGRGYSYDIVELLQYLLRKDPPADASKVTICDYISIRYGQINELVANPGQICFRWGKYDLGTKATARNWNFGGSKWKNC